MFKFPMYSTNAGGIKCLTFISTVLKIHIPTNGEKVFASCPTIRFFIVLVHNHESGEVNWGLLFLVVKCQSEFYFQFII